ncbi:2Fe-2S iron-sulfur cluster binding domain-containing protein [Phycicoccus endophyticus]|uniref:2Fe-2S iron-sulfur cluster binding domain-containing protein n=1 Tax=Phycicoccus endophyticus TaxID=1690220 RepID=A0A7G9R0X8_9MICO|nr:2Fe-2S iron-sulfur cluster-binding protein [Phycicoccus endophyticus]NHI19547.1 2Fe-2S iron-sulfur cluster binding domain-containing protein [Phycicoccus endophyticus]QNN49253.1 2Fe-2S iron-sulfur cluster binding domain-containing protein [Phycicoccus endophyticus]
MPNVTIDPTGEVIWLEPEETVLSGLFRAGFAYTVGCRRGGCAICKVDCLAGTFGYNRRVAESVLSADERTDGTCLSCRAVPQTDVTIRLREGDLRMVNPYLRQINERARQRAEALAAAQPASGVTSKE